MFSTSMVTLTRSAISNGSTVKKISKIVISFVPKLSSTAQKIESITAGTKLVTGSEHATNRKAKKLTHQVGNLIKPNDQVTVKGVGTDIDNISYGFNYSCKTK